MVTPHWPSAAGLGAGLDDPCPVPLDGNGNCPTDAIASMASNAAASANFSVTDLGNPANQLQGSASAAFQQITNSAQPLAALGQQAQAQIGQVTGQVKQAWQGYANEIQTVANYPGASAAAAGMITAANGGTPSDTEIQGAFTVGATTGAILLGATATAAAAVVAPMCAVVWGAGYALEDLIKKIFGITNQGPIHCGAGDTTQYASGPGQPGWITYKANGNFSTADPTGESPQGTVATDGTKPLPGWLPYTRGAFENWARPLIIKAEELWANCKTVPPDNTATTFLKGLVGMWNAQAKSTGPVSTRQICLAGLGSTPLDGQIAALSSTSFPTATRPALYWQLMAWQGDPVQVLLGQVSNEQGGNIAITVANPTPTSTASTTAAGQTTTLHKVAVGTAAVGGAALIGTAVYALAKGQAVETVLKAGWFSLKGWFSR